MESDLEAGVAIGDAERVSGTCQAGSDVGAGGTAITCKVLQLVCQAAAWVGASDEGVHVRGCRW